VYTVFSASVAEPYNIIPHRYTRVYNTMFIYFVGIYTAEDGPRRRFIKISKMTYGRYSMHIIVCPSSNRVCVKYIIPTYHTRHFDRRGARPRNSVSA